MYSRCLAKPPTGICTVGGYVDRMQSMACVIIQHKITFCFNFSQGNVTADDRLFWPCSPPLFQAGVSETGPLQCSMCRSLPAYWTTQALFGMSELI